MKKILNSAWKSIFTGSMFTVWILVVLLWVYAFESWLSTIPSESWFKSGGSQILSKLSTWWFNRTTDSLEAISDKVDAIWGWVTWVWYTSSTNSWNMGYTKWMIDKCDSYSSWSVPMTYQDMLDLWKNYPYTEDAWIIDGSYASNAIQFTKDGYSLSSTSANQPICNWWSQNSNSYMWPRIRTNWYMMLSSCDVNYKIPCVFK